jgi:hypothetical protein
VGKLVSKKMKIIKLNKTGSSHWILVVVLVVIIGLVGARVLSYSKAQTPPTSTTTIFKGNPTEDSTKSPALNAFSGTGVCKPRVCYSYVMGYQFAISDGAAVTLSQEQPKVDPNDSHSLAELAVQSYDGKQTIEIGWTVERNEGPNAKPRLFVFYWVDDKPTCYNTCGFVKMAGSPVMPGDEVEVGTTGRYKILFTSGKWMLYYNSKAIGYFPASLWGGRFTKSGHTQVFGEVASSPTTASKTQMGNGKKGNALNPAKISSFTSFNSSAPVSLTVKPVGAPGIYTYSNRKPNGFTYGGPGY